ncbi:MAG TPA: RsmB/NOP family class I SAM-dependent RNA methyltransferase [Myxococcota bacterium]|nr:RsmB/NOP family class I SAM-dependent RNA methyltransferase [Myxococcota bacterium]
MTEALFEAMLAEDKKVALINPFLDEERLLPIYALAKKEPELGPYIATLPKDLKPELIDGLLSHYFLDRSSCLAPMLLPLAKGFRVLDMCAAPGGKLLYLLSKKIDKVFFVANDISKIRARRLRLVLNDYVPKAFLEANIALSNRDALYFGLKVAHSFDAILLDAPCSSEAHVLKSNRPFVPQKSLPRRQYALLSAAMLAAKTGAYIMYATCSINKDENEGVIKRLLNKKKGACSLAPTTSPVGTSGEFGTTILPHLHGAGPAFFSLIRRH